MRRLFAACAVALLLSPAMTQAQTALIVDGGYYGFRSNAAGTEVGERPALDGLLASSGGPFTFSLFSTGLLRIWDYQQNSEPRHDQWRRLRAHLRHALRRGGGSVHLR